MKRTKKGKSPENISASARAKITARLRNASKRSEYPHLNEFKDDGRTVFPEPADLLGTFRDEFEAVNGELIIIQAKDLKGRKLKELLKKKQVSSVYCSDDSVIKELGSEIPLESSPDKFNEMEAGVTRCEALVARTGTIVVSAEGSGRRMNVFPPIHIILAQSSQLVPFISDAFDLLKNKYGKDMPSQVTFVTGPSRTADIEKALVMGAHGPKEVIVILSE